MIFILTELKKSKTQICEEMGTFITNILKLNAKQLLNRKVKRNKTANSFPSSRNQYGSTSSIHSATTNRGGGSSTSLNYYHQATDLNLNQKQTKAFFSPAHTSLIITSPLANQQLQRNKSSSKSQNNDHFNRNGPSPNSSGYFNNMDYLNGYEDDHKKLPSISRFNEFKNT